LLSNVLLLGMASGIDPSKIATVTYILSKTAKPMRLLVAYLVGGFGVSLILGLFVLFVLRAVGLTSPGAAPANLLIAIGILSLTVALLVGTGLTARIRDWVNERRGSESRDKTNKMEESIQKVPGLRKLLPPIRRALASESPWIAWVAGVGVGIPNAYYVAAITIVLHSGVSPAQQVVYLVVFNVFNFGAVILPVVAYLRTPEATTNLVTRTNAWVAENHRAFVAGVAGVIGVYLIIVGVTHIG
jgi:hypothetical protein